MNKIFTVDLGPKPWDSNLGRIQLNLPATPYELLDVLDKLNVSTPEEVDTKWVQYWDHKYLSDCIRGKVGFVQLNALAERLSAMEPELREPFHALVEMERRRDPQSLSVERLVVLADHAQDVHIAPDVTNNEQLGRFYCDNGFIDAVNDVPDEAYQLLDFEKIGREMCQAEHGIFIHGCYAMVDEELPPEDRVYDLKKPSYTVLLEVENIWTGQKVDLELPANREAIQDRLGQIGVKFPNQLYFSCRDCRVPNLADAFSRLTDIYEANHFAWAVEDVEEKMLPTYKALLDAMHCYDLQDAADLAGSLDDYILSRHICTAEDMAREVLKVIVAPEELAVLEKHIDLNGYGEELLENEMRRGQSAMTDYGHIQRADGEMMFDCPEQPEPEMQL